MSRSWRVAMAATFGLIALQWLEIFRDGPPVHLPPWFLPALLSLPLLPPAIAFLRRRPRAPLWAGIVALLYFCLGIIQLRLNPDAWAWTVVVLSLATVLAAGWPGIAAKLAKRRPAPPPNV